jgi:hypothetical protein
MALDLSAYRAFVRLARKFGIKRESPSILLRRDGFTF